MRKVINDVRLMVKVCDMYYNQNISQLQIAKSLELSRPTVSRLLASAKEQGIVQINISYLDGINHWELERKLEAMYNLSDVLIADEQDSPEELKKALGRLAAGHLAYIIKEGDVIGVSMGSTLREIAPNVSVDKKKDITFVSLIGGMGNLGSDLHSNSLAESLAIAYGGKFVPFHAPARVSNPNIKEELLKEDSLSAAIGFMHRLDIVLVGIGYPNENSAIMRTGYFEENEIEKLISKNVAGDICMQFYDEDGNTSPFKEDNNVVGIDIHQLKKVPHSIGIAGGTDKLSAIRGAIKGRYINTLITDISCAQALLEQPHI